MAERSWYIDIIKGLSHSSNSTNESAYFGQARRNFFAETAGANLAPGEHALDA
jgi:hypothetical protein